MILEVDDQGRVERFVVVRGNPEKTVDGRRLFGGVRLSPGNLEEIWFDMALWDVSLVPDGEYFKTYRITRKAS